MPRRNAWSIVALVAFFGFVFVALFGERLAPYESIYFAVACASSVVLPTWPGLLLGVAAFSAVALCPSSSGFAVG